MTWITNHPKSLKGLWPRRAGYTYIEGEPKKTEACSVQNLKSCGIIGIYVDMPDEDYRKLPIVKNPNELRLNTEICSAMSAPDSTSPKTALRMAWYHRLAQFGRRYLRERREKRISVIRARLKHLKSRREVMLIMGEVIIEKGGGMLLGCLCDIMQAERWEHGKLTKQLEYLEQKLNPPTLPTASAKS